MKNTALSHVHEKLGAKIVPFAGYNMPVQYEGINIEHDTVSDQKKGNLCRNRVTALAHQKHKKGPSRGSDPVLGTHGNIVRGST